MEWYVPVGMAIMIIVMLSASYFDWRYRTVPDFHWWILGLSGIILTACSLPEMRLEWILMLVGSFLILLFILLDVDISWLTSVIWCIVMAVLFIYPAVTTFDSDVTKRLLIIPICFVVFYILYMTGILRGGADAKCLMVTAMVFQTSPAIGCLPLIAIPSLNVQMIFSFPIAILFHAALFSFLWLFWTIIRKIYRKQDPVQMVTLSYYRMSIDGARKSHVWPKQDVVNGMIVNVNGIAPDGALDRLEAAGAKDVWVTPIIPFMIPILMAMVFVITVGSLLNIPFSL